MHCANQPLPALTDADEPNHREKAEELIGLAAQDEDADADEVALLHLLAAFTDAAASIAASLQPIAAHYTRMWRGVQTPERHAMSRDELWDALVERGLVPSDRMPAEV